MSAKFPVGHFERIQIELPVATVAKLPIYIHLGIPSSTGVVN